MEIGHDQLPDELRDRVAAQGGFEALSLRAWLDIAEAWRITKALHQCRGNRSAAARLLGIGRRTLYTKMEKLGIRSTWTVPGGRSGEGPTTRTDRIAAPAGAFASR